MYSDSDPEQQPQIEKGQLQETDNQPDIASTSNSDHTLANTSIKTRGGGGGFA